MTTDILFVACVIAAVLGLAVLAFAFAGVIVAAGVLLAVGGIAGARTTYLLAAPDGEA